MKQTKAHEAKFLEAVRAHAPNAAVDFDTADDGSLLVEVSDKTTGREILFALSPESAKVYFSANETPRISGIVPEQSGIEALLRWLAGTEDFPKKGLLLPSEEEISVTFETPEESTFAFEGGFFADKVWLPEHSGPALVQFRSSNGEVIRARLDLGKRSFIDEVPFPAHGDDVDRLAARLSALQDSVDQLSARVSTLLQNGEVFEARREDNTILLAGVLDRASEKCLRSLFSTLEPGRYHVHAVRTVLDRGGVSAWISAVTSTEKGVLFSYDDSALAAALLYDPRYERYLAIGHEINSDPS